MKKQGVGHQGAGYIGRRDVLWKHKSLRKKIKVMKKEIGRKEEDKGWQGEGKNGKIYEGSDGMDERPVVRWKEDRGGMKSGTVMGWRKEPWRVVGLG